MWICKIRLNKVYNVKLGEMTDLAKIMECNLVIRQCNCKKNSLQNFVPNFHSGS